jgi:acyl-coenzyme A synthetase/AMP-(fatty) acid ligase
MLVLPDGTKLFLPEYESAIAAVLKNPEIAADVKDGRPVLIISGDGDKKAVLQAIRPLMDEQPRGRQISDVIFVKEPLPRTATGKIKRWELRQKAGL